MFKWGPSKHHQNWVGIYASVLTRALGRNLNGLRAFGTNTMCNLRATSRTRLRAHDLYTSSTLIGGKGGAGPSSLHTKLEGPTEYVNARWM